MRQNETKLVVVNSHESWLQMLVDNFLMFGSLVGCIAFSIWAGSVFWTAVSGLFFFFLVLARVSTSFSSRYTVVHSREELDQFLDRSGLTKYNEWK